MKNPKVWNMYEVDDSGMWILGMIECYKLPGLTIWSINIWMEWFVDFEYA